VISHLKVKYLTLSKRCIDQTIVNILMSFPKGDVTLLEITKALNYVYIL